jgi:hypothetical protein
LLEQLSRVVVALVLQVEQAKPLMRAGVLGRQAQRVFEGLLGKRAIAAPLVDGADLEVGHGILRVEGQRLDIQVDREVEAAFAPGLVASHDALRRRGHGKLRRVDHGRLTVIQLAGGLAARIFEVRIGVEGGLTGATGEDRRARRRRRPHRPRPKLTRFCVSPCMVDAFISRRARPGTGTRR